MMLDHVSLPVADLERSSRFYDRVLSCVGLRRRKETEAGIGYGPDAVAPPVFWILRRSERSPVPGPGLHVSFRARNRQDVHAFFDAALGLGAKDAGAPGVRPQYTAGFYGCFVYDLDGYKIEAVAREKLRT
jgi:catechol 2,3-dioxygenase-like lactoylglutathione lyase family enzyme